MTIHGCNKLDDHNWGQVIDERFSINPKQARCRNCGLMIETQQLFDLQAEISAKGKFDERIAVALERIAGALCDDDPQFESDVRSIKTSVHRIAEGLWKENE